MKSIFKININKNRIYGLDILRAFAIIFVVIDHGKHLLPNEYKNFHRIIGFDGVSIFFVLSGFLIGGILIQLVDNNKPTLKLLANFWVRRWFRTIPTFFLVLSFLIVYNYLFNEKFVPEKYLNYYYFSQNLFSKHPGFFPEAWSLSVEEWFYLITPVMIFGIIGFTKLRSNLAILLIATLIIFSVVLYRYSIFDQFVIDSYREWDKMFRKQVFTRLDSLMFGVICAYIKYYYENYFYRNKGVLFCLGIFVFILYKYISYSGYIPFNSMFHCVFSFIVTSIATSLLLPYLTSLKKGTGLLYEYLTIISLVSYSMYLINLSVVRLCFLKHIQIESYFDNTSFAIYLNYFLYWIITLALSILIYKYFEIPTTKLRDSIFVQRLIAKL